MIGYVWFMLHTSSHCCNCTQKEAGAFSSLDIRFFHFSPLLFVVANGLLLPAGPRHHHAAGRTLLKIRVPVRLVIRFVNA
jgi:hypothetical protein